MYPLTEEEYEQMEGHGLVRMNADHGYNTSRDYDRLWDIATNTPVVCFLDYSPTCRDVASTSYYKDKHGESLQISVRGYCYIFACTKVELLAQCVQLNLEFIEPVL